ncbi:unnamed protein product [Tenebrio molitor]|nr:unnamed protein product [Tenebrio molitor]
MQFFKFSKLVLYHLLILYIAKIEIHTNSTMYNFLIFFFFQKTAGKEIQCILS